MVFPLSTGKATLGALGPVLGSLVWERQGHTRGSPAKDHKIDGGTGASLLWGDAERARALHLGKGKVQG